MHRWIYWTGWERIHRKNRAHPTFLCSRNRRWQSSSMLKMKTINNYTLSRTLSPWQKTQKPECFHFLLLEKGAGMNRLCSITSSTLCQSKHWLNNVYQTTISPFQIINLALSWSHRYRGLKMKEGIHKSALQTKVFLSHSLPWVTIDVIKVSSPVIVTLKVMLS